LEGVSVEEGDEIFNYTPSSSESTNHSEQMHFEGFENEAHNDEDLIHDEAVRHEIVTATYGQSVQSFVEDSVTEFNSDIAQASEAGNDYVVLPATRRPTTVDAEYREALSSELHQPAQTVARADVANSITRFEGMLRGVLPDFSDTRLLEHEIDIEEARRSQPPPQITPLQILPPP
jgi:hypothetical protein